MVIRFPDYPFPVLVVGSVCKLQLAGEVFQDLCGSLQKLRDGLKSLREVLELLLLFILLLVKRLIDQLPIREG